MCGRAYATYSDEELYFRYLQRTSWGWATAANPPKTVPNCNICPTHILPVLRVNGGSLEFAQCRWGLVPGWAKSVAAADKYSMINARAEEISEKRSYRAAFRSRRCLVPVSGFYEWKKPAGEGRKIPFAVHLRDEPIMSIAGIYEQWRDPEQGAIVDSFAIVTTSANEFMAGIHSRMPVILGRDDERAWLDPETPNPDIFLKGCPSDWLAAFEVSSAVNSPQNNSPKLLEPVCMPLLQMRRS